MTNAINLYFDYSIEDTIMLRINEILKAMKIKWLCAASARREARDAEELAKAARHDVALRQYMKSEHLK